MEFPGVSYYIVTVFGTLLSHFLLHYNRVGGKRK